MFVLSLLEILASLEISIKLSFYIFVKMISIVNKYLEKICTSCIVATSVSQQYDIQDVSVIT